MRIKNPEKSSFMFKIIALILVQAFITLDFAWAGTFKSSDNPKREFTSALSPAIKLDSNTLRQVFVSLINKQAETKSGQDNYGLASDRQLIERYLTMTEGEKQDNREKFEEAFVKQLEYRRRISPLFNEEIMRELVATTRKLISDYPNARIVSLGRSPLLFVETANLIELLENKKSNADRFIYAAFSKTWHRRRGNIGPLVPIAAFEPKGKQIEAYRNYLKKLGMDPGSIVENREKTVIAEYTYLGEGLMSFLSFLLNWAEELGIAEELKDKVIVNILQDPAHKEFSDFGGFTVKHQLVGHDFLDAIVNNHKEMIGIGVGTPYPMERWLDENVNPFAPENPDRAFLEVFWLLDFLIQNGLVDIVDMSERKNADAFGMREAERKILSPMPIKSIVFNEEIESQILESLMERIKSCVSWQDMSPDGFSGGRKIILKLENPIILSSGKVIRGLEIKGVVYKNKDELTIPPQKEIYSTVNVLKLGRENKVVSVKSLSLKGGLSLKKAKRENMILTKFHGEGRYEYDYPVGYGEYLDYTYKGKKFGFVITGVEGPARKRLGELFYENKQYRGILSLAKEYPDRVMEMVVTLFNEYKPLFREYGRALRDLHDRGYYHRYPHLLNVSWDEKLKRVVFHDFEATAIIRHLPFEKRVGYRMLDLDSAYAHFLKFIFDKGDSYAKRRLFTNKLDKYGKPFDAFWEGYFATEMQTENVPIDSLANQISDTVSIANYYPLHKRKIWVIEKLNEIENKKTSILNPELEKIAPQIISNLIEQAI